MRILAVLLGTLGLTSALSAQADEFTQALPPASAPAQVLMQVTILQVNGSALAESEVDLAEVFTGWSDKAGEISNGVLTDTLSRREIALLTTLLRSVKLCEVISRPQVITLENQKAQVQVGQNVPLVTIQETVNGQTMERLETKPVGLLLDLTPTQVTKDSLQITVSLQQSEYEPEGTDRSGKKRPVIKARRIQTQVKVPLGETLLVTESSLLAPTENPEDGEQLLLTITPRIIGPAPPGAVVAAGDFIASPPKVQRPRKLPFSKTVDAQATWPVPSRPSPAAAVPPSKSASTWQTQPSTSVDEELRLLRESVEVLRQDVRRLIQILEDRTGKESESISPRLPRPMNSQLHVTPTDTSDAIWISRLGVKLAAVSFSPSTLDRIHYRGGLKIVELDEKGPAAKAGLAKGDVLVGLNNWESVTLSNLTYVLEHWDKQDEDRLKCLLVRKNETLSGYFHLPPIKSVPAVVELQPDTPEAVVKQMLRGGTSDEMRSLLSKKARREVARLGLEVDFQNPEEYMSRVGAASYPHPGAQTASVSGVLIRKGLDGKTEETHPTWHLRREDDGWRITGMETPSKSRQKPVSVDFENLSEAMDAFSRRATVTPDSTPQWQPSRGTVRTANFVVQAPTPQLASELAHQAEEWRSDLAVRFLGRELVAWSKPCAVKALLTNDGKSGGSTSYAFSDKGPANLSMNIQGASDSLQGVLAHEVMHTVLATHFGRPIPRRLEEGIATSFDNEARRQEYLRLAKQCLHEGDLATFEELASFEECPADTEAVKRLRAQAYCLVQMLLSRADEDTLIDFIEEGIQTTQWSAALESHYKFGDSADVAWKKWLEQQ